MRRVVEAVRGKTRREGAPAKCGFTIIEIALCLGIIGFALVAIIAVLPRGLDVQKRNREETIVNQDAQVWMNLLRNGERQDDDLTNYIIAITNIWTTFVGTNPAAPVTDWYTVSNSSIGGGFALTNGERIVGLLSTPKIVNPALYGHPPADYQSNYIIAYVRAFSGPEVDKPPQNNGTVLGDAFIYRMIVENYQGSPFDTNDICMNCASNSLWARGTSVVTTASQWIDRTNLAYTTWMLQTNSHDFRLVFRFPVLPNGQIPDYGVTTYRSMASGQLDLDLTNTDQPLFFVNPRVYAQLTNRPTNLP